MGKRNQAGVTRSMLIINFLNIYEATGDDGNQ